MNMLYVVRMHRVSDRTRTSVLSVLTDVRRGPNERNTAKSEAEAHVTERFGGDTWTCIGIQAVCETPNRVLMVVS
jgi:hypothetical protein